MRRIIVRPDNKGKATATIVEKDGERPAKSVDFWRTFFTESYDYNTGRNK